MIDKIGDDKCFIGAYAYHVAVRNKINELVDAVNKLESHRHEYYRSTGVNVNMATSEPICNSQNEYLNEVNHGELEVDLEKINLKQVMQEVYDLANIYLNCARTTDDIFHAGRFEKIATILKPYIEEK